MTIDDTRESAWDARKLLRAARAGTLATSIDGQPFASLVTPAVAADGALLMLLSGLSEHTRHLRVEPRCAIMVAGGATEANPQTAPRVTVTGLAEPTDDAALKERWLAIHPYAAFYAGFGDFSLWRVAPVAGQFIGGFARATRLRGADLVPEAAAAATISASRGEIISHCNTDHADAMDAIAQGTGGVGSGWSMIDVDTDGCDIAREERVVRVAWAQPASEPGSIRRELILLARAARASS